MRTLKKTLRRPVTLTFSLIQPLFWMLFFGFLMQRYPIDTLPGGVDYKSFLVPGICAMTVLFGASQAGAALMRDMQTGFLQRMLLTPAPRWILHLGKITADGLRLQCQALAVLLLGSIVGASVSFAALPFIVSFLSLFFFAIAFGSLSCVIALRARRAETMATFVHVVNMPIFFTSTALVPHKQMPDWLAAIARWNPLTLAVENLREALLFQSMPPFISHVAPLFVLAMLMLALAIIVLRTGTVISTWETR
jgi:ABC-2 type transport system permease protein